jgi:hypothetical protein
VLNVRWHHRDADERHDGVLVSELGRAVRKEADLARARLAGVAHARAKALWVSPRMQVGAALEPVRRWCRFEAR